MAALLVGCAEPDHRPLVIGHGGAGFSSTNALASNSRASIERALVRYDVDGVELDVQVAADGTLMAFHDRYLAPETDCEGRVGEKTYAALKDCAYRHNRWSVDLEPILSLDEAVAVVLRAKPGAHLFLDVKVFASRAPVNDSLAAGLRGVTQRVKPGRLWATVGVESTAARLRQALGEDIRILYDAKTGAEGREAAERLGLDGFAVTHERAGGALVKQARETGLWVAVHGVKSYEAARDAVDLEPSAVLADDIPALQAVLD